MTEKRFTLSGVALNNPNAIRDDKELLTQKEVVDKLNGLYCSNLKLLKSNDFLLKENEQLKKAIDDFKAYGGEEFKEVEHINNIYKKEGFNGVIDYAKDKLQYYGVVKEVEKGLWVLVTGGWSDNEFFIHCLNDLLSNFGRKHYRAYEKGGAFYYTEEPRADVEISLKKESRE